MLRFINLRQTLGHVIVVGGTSQGGGGNNVSSPPSPRSAFGRKHSIASFSALSFYFSEKSSLGSTSNVVDFCVSRQSTRKQAEAVVG